MTLYLRIVDENGRPTPAFLKQLQQLSVSQADAMPSPTPVSIKADYTGVFLSSSLPATVSVQRTSNGVDVTAQSQWALEVTSGTISATIVAGNITITSLGSSTGVLQVKSSRNHVDLYCNVTVNKVLGQAPSTGGTASGGGSTTTATATSFSDISSSTDAVITPTPLQVTVGASGNVALSAPLDVTTLAASPTGTFPVYGKWQWYNGAAWADVAAEVGSSPVCTVTRQIDDPGLHSYTYFTNDGSLTVNVTKTGLTPGATAQFQLLARNSSGTRDMTFSGTASAVPQ